MVELDEAVKNGRQFKLRHDKLIIGDEKFTYDIENDKVVKFNIYRPR